MEKIKHVMLVAGEASGDLHAAHLVEELKKIDPQIRFSGCGGPSMAAQGVKIDEDLTAYAVVGFFEVLKHLREFKKIFQDVLKKVTEQRPDAIILVDYPGFNLRLAQAIKDRGLPTKVIFYISPQVWAWKEKRVERIKKVVDRMLVILPFEKEFYQERGFEVDFIGHPLLDAIRVSKSREEFLERHGLSVDKFTIALLPGSRKKEVENLLPVMLKSAEILFEENKSLQFIVLKATGVNRSWVEHQLQPFSFPVKIVHDQTYNGIHAAQFCIVASGTATLETAILERPMIVVYKTSFLTWALAKFLVKIKSIGLVNVVAGKQIVPECVQYDATPAKIASKIKSIYQDELQIATIKEELRRVRHLLGDTGASRRAAKLILNFLNY